MHCVLLIVLGWAQGHSTDLPDMVARSGRVIEAMSIRERLADPLKEIAPGMPPLLAFRYFDGADRHRFGKLDLMVDDAGH